MDDLSDSVDAPIELDAGRRRALTEETDREAEGAITLARTLLEEVCKHIIEEAGETYAEKDELPKLYRSAAIILKLAPDQHTEDTFKRVLGGCQVSLKDWEQCGTSFATHMVVGGSRSDQRPGTLLLR